MRASLAGMLVVAIGLMAVDALAAQSVGDRVRLDATNPAGVPAHPAAGDSRFVRWTDGTTGAVSAFDNTSGWFEVTADDGAVGWFTRRYLVLLDAGDEEEPTNESLTYVIAAWNLEHLRDGTRRGFPENTNGGPSLPPRVDADYAHLADIITTQLDAKLLMLSEINGLNDGTSIELDRLVSHLGDDWEYVLGSSGANGRQRVAILHDTRFVQRNLCLEFVVPDTEVQSNDIFDRDPLVCHVTLMDLDGTQRNDLIVVTLHLASDQRLAANHNAAMERLRTDLQGAFSDGDLPADERDILIGGDLNASRYGGPSEDFWDNYDATGFRFITLAPVDGDSYPGTRLAGVPLEPRSQIDYMIASDITRGLTGELVQRTATVRHDVILSGFDDFRARASDHVPVTVQIVVGDDTDQ